MASVFCWGSQASDHQGRGHKSIYLHRSGPLLENALDRPENGYGRYGFAGFFQHFHIYRRGGWSESVPLKIFISCSLGGGGRWFSVPCQGSGEFFPSVLVVAKHKAWHTEAG